MNLLTVTCWKDIQPFRLQLISIKTYLIGQLTHYIVINDDPATLTKKRKNAWYRLVSKVYQPTISYEIIFAEWNETWGKSDHAWRAQQIYKLCYYEKIKTDYVILDSKNLFIRKTHIDDFKSMIGCGRTSDPSPFTLINKVYAENFNREPIQNPLTPWTPFAIKSDILKDFGTADDIAKTLYSLRSSDNIWPSEFIFYSYLTTQSISDITPSVESINTWGNGDFDYFLHTAENRETIKVIGIHRAARASMTRKQIKRLNYFLSVRGLF